MSNRAELELNLKDTGFDKAANDLRNLGTAAQTSGKNIQTTTTNIKNAETQSVSFGQKVKSLGSNFQSTVANVSTLGLSVVNLQRGYRDLGDAQIAVDRTNLKVNKSQEAVRKATDALAVAQKKYGSNSKQAQQAALDLAQAVEKLKVDTLNAGEAQERFGDIQQNFWMGIVPTITSAGGTMLSMFSNLAGDKGIGGLTSKLGSIKGGFSSLADGIGISSKALAGMSLALGGVVLGLIELDKQMKLAQWGHEFDAAGGASHRTLDQLSGDIAKAKEEMNSWGSQVFTTLKAVGQAMAFNPKGAAETLDFWPNVIKSLEQTQNRKEAIVAYQNAIQDIISSPMAPDTKTTLIKQAKDIINVLANDFNYAARTGVTAQQATDYTQNFLLGPNGIIPAFEKAVKGGEAQGRLRAIGLEIGKAVMNLGGGATGMQFPTPDQTLFNKLLGAGNPTARTTTPQDNAMAQQLAGTIKSLTAESIKNSGAVKQNKAMNDALAIAEANLAKNTTDAANAARDHALAASEETGGLNKIFAAYAKLEPKVEKVGKGSKKTGTGQLPITKASDFIDKFEHDLAPLLVNPASAQTYAVNWVKTAASKLGGNASKLLKPIIDYINTHKNDAPLAFTTGLEKLLNDLNLTDVFRQVFQGAPTAAGEAATKSNAALGKMKVPPATKKSVDDLAKELKILPQFHKTQVTTPGATQSKSLLQGYLGIINKIPKKITTTVNVKVNTSGISGPSGQALAHGIKLWGGQHGGDMVVNSPTLFMAGEDARERVTVQPMSGAHSSGGGSGDGDVYVGPIYLDGEKVQDTMRLKMNRFQGTFK